MYGQDYGYAATRLNGTIVCDNNGIPVTVHAINGRGVCTTTLLETGDEKHMHLDEINPKPVKLGFVNYRGRAIYIARIPKRAGPNNQGLRRENSRAFGGHNYPPAGAICKTIQNSYPSFANAVTASKKGENYSCAWDRHWAIKEGKTLMYKGFGDVGTINSKKGFELKKGFEYLKEYLLEVLNG